MKKTIANKGKNNSVFSNSRGGGLATRTQKVRKQNGKNCTRKNLKFIENFLLWLRRNKAEMSGNIHHYSGFCLKKVGIRSRKHRLMKFYLSLPI